MVVRHSKKQIIDDHKSALEWWEYGQIEIGWHLS